jgi:hypothetical protein
MSGDRIHVEVRFPGPVRNGHEVFPSYYKMGMESLSGWINGRIVELTNQALIAQKVKKD